MAKPGKGSGEELETFEEEGPIEAEEQLALADGEERLPWLESDDDYEQPGVDTGRVVAFAAVGLLAVVLVVGAIWWFTRDRTDEALVADGGVIEAPDAPYKTRPDDPGGRQVEGTGDTSFEVAEGETDWVPVVKEFYEPFAETLEKASALMERVEIADEPSDEICDLCGRPGSVAAIKGNHPGLSLG